MLYLFVRFDSLHPSQQFFTRVRTGLPGLNQYYTKDKVSCSKDTTQWQRWGLNLQPHWLQGSTLELSHYTATSDMWLNLMSQFKLPVVDLWGFCGINGSCSSTWVDLALNLICSFCCLSSSSIYKYITQLIQGSYRQVGVRFKDFSRTSKRRSYCFQGLKPYEKYWLTH